MIVMSASCFFFLTGAETTVGAGSTAFSGIEVLTRPSQATRKATAARRMGVFIAAMLLERLVSCHEV